jgi:hypothetical protein
MTDESSDCKCVDSLYWLLASQVREGSGPPDTQITEAVETIDRDVAAHLGGTALS